jgi:hypothetical protein
LDNPKTPVYDLAEFHSSKGAPESYLARSNASFSLTNVQRDIGTAEVYQEKAHALNDSESARSEITYEELCCCS